MGERPVAQGVLRQDARQSKTRLRYPPISPSETRDFEESFFLSPHAIELQILAKYFLPCPGANCECPKAYRVVKFGGLSLENRSQSSSTASELMPKVCV